MRRFVAATEIAHSTFAKIAGVSERDFEDALAGFASEYTASAIEMLFSGEFDFRRDLASVQENFPWGMLREAFEDFCRARVVQNERSAIA